MLNCFCLDLEYVVEYVMVGNIARLRFNCPFGDNLFDRRGERMGENLGIGIGAQKNAGLL